MSIFWAFCLIACCMSPEIDPQSELSSLTTAERCGLTPDPGPCKAYFQKFYYDKAEGVCKEFIWGGCQGTVPFDTLEECELCKDS